MIENKELLPWDKIKAPEEEAYLRFANELGEARIEYGVLYINSIEATENQMGELAEKISTENALFQATQYQRDRAKEYPSLQEQADLAYWDRQNGTNKLDEIIFSVKAKFPKPKNKE